MTTLFPVSPPCPSYSIFSPPSPSPPSPLLFCYHPSRVPGLCLHWHDFLWRTSACGPHTDKGAPLPFAFRKAIRGCHHSCHCQPQYRLSGRALGDCQLCAMEGPASSSGCRSSALFNEPLASQSSHRYQSRLCSKFRHPLAVLAAQLCAIDKLLAARLARRRREDDHSETIGACD